MSRDILIVTVETPPIGYVVETLFPAVEVTLPIDLHSKGLFDTFMSSKPSVTREDAQQMLATLAPPQANAMIGLRTSSAIGQFKDKVILYVTYLATPAIIVRLDASMPDDAC
jgi:hypothetical protein